uniref:Uncharacterized protein n=1 Tax=Ananas comosus var. bracteatus TaxID=296719 RepID=A0A6V7NTJ4_ANACO|nr:unnamed protein product [Ananas comosus var. bracteatus]
MLFCDSAAAPLAGQLKIAETVKPSHRPAPPATVFKNATATVTNKAAFKHPSSTSPSPSTSTSASASTTTTTTTTTTAATKKKKNNKYVLKRRDGDLGYPRPPLPDLRLPPPLPGPVPTQPLFFADSSQSSPSPSSALLLADAAASGGSGYVLQKRPPPPPPQLPPPYYPGGSDGGSFLPQGGARSRAIGRRSTECLSGRKRPRSAPERMRPPPPPGTLRRRRKRRNGRTFPLRRGPLLPSIYRWLKSLRSLKTQPQILSDLQELALDPFHGIDRDAPSIARYVFLKFRSLVYQKSLPSVVPGELDSGKPTAGQPPPARDERQHSAPGSKLLKMIPRPDDPTKGGKKRIPSDRQEEMGVKKQKKIAQIKSMATEKKAGISQKPPEADPREQKEATSASATKAEPVRKKQEPPPPPPPPKARFARFGPLDLAGTRVYWKSHSCKVIFKFKTDAETALNYIKNNDLFGQVKVHSYIRDVEADPSVDLSMVRPESRPAADAPPFKPPGNISSSGNGNGNGNGGGGSSSSSSSILGPAPSLQQARLPVTQPKSILKKPGDELGPAAGSTARDAPRVKFLLDNTGGDSKAEPPSMVSGNGNGGSSTDGRASSIPSVDPPATKNNPRSVSFNTLQPPPPPLTRPSSSLPSRIPPPTQPLASAALPPRGSDGLIQLRAGSCAG